MSQELFRLPPVQAEKFAHLEARQLFGPIALGRGRFQKGPGQLLFAAEQLCNFIWQFQGHRYHKRTLQEEKRRSKALQDFARPVNGREFNHKDPYALSVLGYRLSVIGQTQRQGADAVTELI
jgi:hypothetical protein